MRYWKRIVILIILLALGFAIGWFMEGTAIQESPVPNQVGSGTTIETRKERNGYCCIQAGSECTEMPTPGDCFMQRGKVFNSDFDRCTQYCLYAQP